MNKKESEELDESKKKLASKWAKWMKEVK